MADHPLEECLATINTMRDAGVQFVFYQKWTCRHCGLRQEMEQPDVMFRSGICEACQRATIIRRCNYTVIINLNRGPPGGGKAA